MECNRVELSGNLAEIGALRYSPAGIPIIEFILAHSSDKMEAGIERKVNLDMACLAVSDMAVRISKLKSGSGLNASGFLAKKSLRSTQIVMHIDHIELKE